MGSGWVGGWVSRQEEGGLNELLDSMVGWVGEEEEEEEVGGWVGGRVRYLSCFLVTGGKDLAHPLIQFVGTGEEGGGEGGAGGCPSFLLLLLLLLLFFLHCLTS